LVAGELDESVGFISAAIEHKYWWGSEVEPGTKAWEEHQHVLASYLSYDAWSDVRWAIGAVHSTHHLYLYARAAKHQIIEDAHAELLTGYVENMSKGRASLQPYLRKWRRLQRLLKPLHLRRAVARQPLSGSTT
jgi:hypothetical protein